MKKVLKVFFIFLLMLTSISLMLSTIFFGRVKIKNNGMNPYLKQNTKYWYSKVDKNFKKFDFVSIYENKNKQHFVSQIIGIQGDKVEIKNSKLIINNKKINNFILNTKDNINLKMGEVQKNKVMFLNSNLDNSIDSRHVGQIDVKNIEFKIYKHTLFDWI